MAVKQAGSHRTIKPTAASHVSSEAIVRIKEFCHGLTLNVLNVSCIQTKMRGNVIIMMISLIADLRFFFHLVTVSSFSIKKTPPPNCIFRFPVSFNFLSK